MDITGLSPVVQAFFNPGFYPHKCSAIDLLQTQMSYVFLTGDYAYKIKMPVNLGYLDYTTLEKREYFCNKELLLNRRLAPDVYLKVIPVVERDGVYALGGAGKIVEYVLKMKQLPGERMMNVLLEDNKVSPDMVVKVARKLANFHASAETGREISKYGNIDSIRINTEENFSQTKKYIGISITPEQYKSIEKYTNDFLERNEVLFGRRVDNGHIRDCHGDVHSAHICFTDDIAIYDCIEFNDRFRYCDVASEIAFLAMDMEYSGHYDLSAVLMRGYMEASQDNEINDLLNFYKCYRAYVRGKVWSFKMDVPHLSPVEREEARITAGKYFTLAGSYIGKGPVLVITAGLMGTGKSTLVNYIASLMGIRVISSDVTRKELAGILLTQHEFAEFDQGIYTPEFTRRTYQQMIDWARELLLQGQSVILDASFKEKEERARAIDLARETGARFLLVECVLDEELVKQRLEQRIREGSVSDGRWELLAEQKKKFDKITEIPGASHLIVDTAIPVEQLAKKVITAIKKADIYAP